MGDLTAASGSEIALLRTAAGLVLRIGRRGGGSVTAAGASRVIAHTHTNGDLKLSADDFVAIFLNPIRRQRSTIVVAPNGWWQRFSSAQRLLGGSIGD